MTAPFMLCMFRLRLGPGCASPCPFAFRSACAFWNDMFPILASRTPHALGMPQASGMRQASGMLLIFAALISIYTDELALTTSNSEYYCLCV